MSEQHAESAELRDKLCRELAQAEYDAVRHTTREAKRLGAIPPAAKLRAIAEHAASLRPRFEQLTLDRQPAGVWLARAVGETFSTIRHLFADRLIRSERSYRATLLGLKHGLDAARLLREVAVVLDETALFEFCDVLIEGRSALISDAEDALRWFARHPGFALESGLVVAFHSAESDTAKNNAADS